MIFVPGCLYMSHLELCVCFTFTRLFDLIIFLFFYIYLRYHWSFTVSNSPATFVAAATAINTGTGSPLGAVVMPEVRLATDAVLIGFSIYAVTAGDVEFMVDKILSFLVLFVGGNYL